MTYRYTKAVLRPVTAFWLFAFSAGVLIFLALWVDSGWVAGVLGAGAVFAGFGAGWTTGMQDRLELLEALTHANELLGRSITLVTPPDDGEMDK